MTELLLQSMSVATSMQNWSNGDANEGWLFTDNSTNGADAYSSEIGTLSDRPKLTVNYTPPWEAPALPATQQPAGTPCQSQS